MHPNGISAAQFYSAGRQIELKAEPQILPKVDDLEAIRLTRL
jgi:hypothetical protein